MYKNKIVMIKDVKKKWSFNDYGHTSFLNMRYVPTSSFIDLCMVNKLVDIHCLFNMTIYSIYIVFEWNRVKRAMLLKYVLCVCEDYLLTRSNIESYDLLIIEIPKQKSRLVTNLPCICLTCGFILCFR